VTSTTLDEPAVREAAPEGPPETAPNASAPSTLSVAAAVACATSAAAGLVHAAAAGSHNGERTLALLFALAAVGQLGCAALVAARPSRVRLLVVAAVNAGALAAWAFTRVRGISFIGGLEERQDIALADASAASFESLAAISAVVALLSFARGRVAPRTTLVALGAVALLGAVPAMAAPHDHGGGHTGATDVAAGGTAGHGHESDSAVAEDPNLVLGVKLPQVDGVTQDQKIAAATLINETRAALTKFPDTAAAERAGFVSIGDGRTGFEHFVNRTFLANQNTLDPDEPESLVFKVNPDGTKTLASAMYILPPGTTMADVPDVAGPMTEWHDHQNLCWDATGVRLAGILVDGQCRPGGTFRPTPPMLHVWVTEHPCGPFAGIEGSAHTGACHSSH
jgi:hypothetical protein